MQIHHSVCPITMLHVSLVLNGKPVAIVYQTEAAFKNPPNKILNEQQQKNASFFIFFARSFVCFWAVLFVLIYTYIQLGDVILFGRIGCVLLAPNS